MATERFQEELELHVSHCFHPVFDHFYDLMTGTHSLGAAHDGYYFHNPVSLISRKRPGGNILDKSSSLATQPTKPPKQRGQRPAGWGLC
jgi:hypothetical protein